MAQFIYTNPHWFQCFQQEYSLLKPRDDAGALLYVMAAGGRPAWQAARIDHSQFLFNDPGFTVSDQQEVLFVGEIVGDNPRFHAMFLNDTSDDRTFYRVGLRDGGLEIASYLNGGFTSHATGSTTFAQNAGVFVACRGQAVVSGGEVHLKIRAWEPADPDDPLADEPAGWDLETSTSRFITEGHTGLWCWNDPVVRVTKLSVGTGGDAAPNPMVTGTISGVTRDAEGDPLGECDVSLFFNVDGLLFLATSGVSDASGNYEFQGGVGQGQFVFAVAARKEGSPNVYDVTDFTLELT